MGGLLDRGVGVFRGDVTRKQIAELVRFLFKRFIENDVGHASIVADTWSGSKLITATRNRATSPAPKRPLPWRSAVMRVTID
jgi:hypothetical protein